MRWKRTVAMMRKEAIQILRDPRSLTIVFVMPIVLMLVFGYGVSLDIQHIATCVFDRDNTPQSRDLIARFRASPYFNVVESADNYRELTRAIDAGRARLAIVIPPDFARRLSEGGTVPVQAIVDATDDNTANLGINYSEGVIRAFSNQVQLDWRERNGLPPASPVLRVDERTWFNEDLESSVFIVPAVIAIVMAVVGTFLTSLTIAREWERGTMEQLISTPVTPLEILVGKLVPYFVIGMADTALCASMAVNWFGVEFHGSWTVLFLSTALFLVAVLTLGYFLSVVAKSQLAASQLALVTTFMPAFLLSGFLFPIEQMPAALQWITHVIPARYYVTLVKALFLKGAPAAWLRPQLEALAIFALVLGAAATTIFHKRLD
ncbi:MAG: ABC transporter permease [Acidobacteriota bacterium]|nr:ABC transporter permease [Acidobacteriota bacterium]